jgi:hypothetical protein
MQYSENYTKQSDWHNIGNLSTAQAALTTDKSAATVNALTSTGTIIFEAEEGAVTYEFRFRGGTDTQKDTLNIYAMRGASDHYALIATLTDLETGTQTDGTYLFKEVVPDANPEQWGNADDMVSVDGIANDIGKLILNTLGYSHFLFIATTLNSAALYIDAARRT